jgi:hypothetical protein
MPVRPADAACVERLLHRICVFLSAAWGKLIESLGRNYISLLNRCFFRRCPEISFDPHVGNVISKRFFTIPILYHNSMVSARDAKRVISKMYLFGSILQKIMIKFY